MKKRPLDLFCGAGGAAMGYSRAGFEIVGVDNVPQPRYPFTFIEGDAMTFPLEGFDAIHASPPCQGYSRMRHLPWLKGRVYPMLIEPIRARLQANGAPFVIENVYDAPLTGIWLCGTQFGMPLLRHRRFESGFFELVAPSHAAHKIVLAAGGATLAKRYAGHGRARRRALPKGGVMSVITHVLVQGASPADIKALDDWAFGADPQRHQKFGEIKMDSAGGSKFFVDGVYAAAFNHFPWWDLVEKMEKGETWRQSGEVFWTVSHEDGYRAMGMVDFRGRFVKVLKEPETAEKQS